MVVQYIYMISLSSGVIWSSNGTGSKTGRSLLIEDGALPWIVQNANNDASPIRRHIELALCHLAQHGKLDFSMEIFERFLSLKIFLMRLRSTTLQK